MRRAVVISACAAMTVGLPVRAEGAGAGVRLTPQAVATLRSTDGGAGTSGVGGIRTTILAGSPGSTGPYTIALRVPANTRIAAHSHRDARSAVVVSGQWWLGYGARAGKLSRMLPPGSFYTEPAGRPHFARTGNQPVTVYITGFGPTDTRYVEPSNSRRR